MKLNERLLLATESIERLLHQNGYLKNPEKRNLNQKYITVKDINGLVDRTAQFLIKPSTKRSLESRSYSAEKYDNLEKIALALEVLLERKNFAHAQCAITIKQNQMLLDSKKMFVVIKEEVIEHVNQSNLEIEQQRSVLLKETEVHQTERNRLQETNRTLQEVLGNVEDSESIQQVKEELEKKEKVYFDYEKKKASLQQYAHELESKKMDADATAEKSEKNSDSLQTLNKEIELVRAESIEQEKQIAILVEVLKENPEEQRE